MDIAGKVVSNRREELDALRGIAAVVVLLHHAHWLWPPPWALPDSLLLHTPLRMIATGRAPVLFFFVLSGFVLTLAVQRRKSFRMTDWYWRRTLRLCLPITAGLLLSLLLYHLCRFHPISHRLNPFFWQAQWGRLPTWTDWFEETALLGDATGTGYPLDAAVWSLAHEWRISVLLPLVVIWRRAWIPTIAVSALVSVVLIFSGEVAPDITLGRGLMNGLASTLYFTVFFAAGYAMAVSGARLPKGKTIRFVAWMMVLAGCSIGRDSVVLLGSCALIALVSDPASRSCRLLRGGIWQELGRISYSLYITHLPVFLTVVAWCGLFMPPVELAVVSIVCALLVATVFFWTVEMPAHRLSQFHRKRIAPPVLGGDLPPTGPTPL
ncbi:hypothetical protein HK16_11530 [Acetobacter senegalensis]|uniref:Acyltransferase n=2 Tax=Acetobacter TaxID=434 RepID=A0A291PI26_9PROT|nr:acyltransferase [Acetobacter senegalensis]ATJ91024.1 acyltransferase [Acetobacter tropicalis]OUL66240.1 hypothetical protein HK16_11530 [Acetobacter senegalensis]CEF39869.1 hypothetical acyltransferase 3 [Acetobacter senegalensis]